MKAVANDAATLVGLGDGRSVGYGRFHVEAFVFPEDEPQKPAVAKKKTTSAGKKARSATA